MEPPSAQSPFAQSRYSRPLERRVHRPLRGGSSSVIARTDSFANKPLPCSPAQRLMRRSMRGRILAYKEGARSHCLAGMTKIAPKACDSRLRLRNTGSVNSCGVLPHSSRSIHNATSEIIFAVSAAAKPNSCPSSKGWSLGGIRHLCFCRRNPPADLLLRRPRGIHEFVCERKRSALASVEKLSPATSLAGHAKSQSSLAIGKGFCSNPPLRNIEQSSFQ